MFGFGGCVLMFAAATLNPASPRHITWLSFVFSFIISTASYSLLFITGYLHDPSPPFALCVTQGALVYSVPMLSVSLLLPYSLDGNSLSGCRTAGTIVSLITHIFFNVRNAMTEAGFSNKWQRPFSHFVRPSRPATQHCLLRACIAAPHCTVLYFCWDDCCLFDCTFYFPSPSRFLNFEAFHIAGNQGARRRPKVA